MPRTCTICASSKRKEIDKDLVQKVVTQESFDTIATRFGVNRSALIRHYKTHLSKDIPIVVQTPKREYKNITATIEEALQNLEWAELKAKEKEDIRAFITTTQSKMNFCLKMLELQPEEKLVSKYQNLGIEYKKLVERCEIMALEIFQITTVLTKFSLLLYPIQLDAQNKLMEEEKAKNLSADDYREMYKSLKEPITKKETIEFFQRKFEELSKSQTFQKYTKLQAEENERKKKAFYIFEKEYSKLVNFFPRLHYILHYYFTLYGPNNQIVNSLNYALNTMDETEDNGVYLKLIRKLDKVWKKNNFETLTLKQRKAILKKEGLL